MQIMYFYHVFLLCFVCLSFYTRQKENITQIPSTALSTYGLSVKIDDKKENVAVDG